MQLETKYKSSSLPIAYKSPVLSLAYSSSRQMLAIGQMESSKGNATLCLWDTKKEVVRIVEDVFNNVGAVCFDNRDKFLFYSDQGKLVRYDIDSRQKQEFEIDNEKITKIIPSKSKRMVVSGKYVQVLDIDTGKSIWKSEEYEAGSKTKNLELEGLPAEWKSSKLTHYNEAAVVEIFSDGKTILVGGHNKGNIEEIDVESGKVLRKIFPAPVQAYSMSLGCNESVLAVSSKIPYANFVWALESAQRMLPEIFNERFGGYSSLYLHPTERLMVSGSLVGFVSVQNLENGKFLFSKKLHDARVSQVLFSDKSNTVFSASDDGEVKISEFNI
jgi:WD40 repeat protein